MALLLLLLLLHFPPTTSSSSPLCEQHGNYTANSTFQFNLNHLLSSLPANSSLSGFATAAYGQIPDKVYGLAQCRADSNLSNCHSCLSAAAKDILQRCPFYNRAVIWFDSCLLHYADEQFFSSVDNSVLVQIPDSQTVPNPDRFDSLVSELMNKISQAAYNSSVMLATGRLSYGGDFPAIYGMEECTRDLSAVGCDQCLQQILIDLPVGKQGGRVLGKSCNFRYEVYSFFEGDPTILINVPTSPDSPPPLFSPMEEGDKNTTRKVLPIVIPLVIALVLTFTVSICFWRRRSAKKIPNMTKLEEISSVDSLLFELPILKVATANFSDVNKLGQGGFGIVYKGTLPDGEEIAVKRLSRSSRQGLQELKNELMFVAKLQHRNLVRLRGVCLEDRERLLVYEYLPNRSLDTFLFDPIKREQLHWERRFKIIRGIARGLLYLHEESQLKIIHRDLKSSNILLDADMNPKISDFGLARLFDGDQTREITRRVVGTFGYIAPEYALRGQFSIKSDVYSFGVLVLEIVTGRKNSSFLDSEHAEDLLSYTWEHWTNGTILEILDLSLGQQCSTSEVLRCIQTGLLCVQEAPADRPRMSAVILMLSSHSVALRAPSRPAFCAGMSKMESATKMLSVTANEVSISELEPR